MALNYTQRAANLDLIAQEIKTAMAQLSTAVATAQLAKDALAAIGTNYAATIAEIDAAATAAPSDGAVQAQKQAADKYVADWQAQSAIADAVIAAGS